jgi:multisubunit Na+/H+ antiporter MnhF subunit
MHETVFYAAAVWMTGLLGAIVVLLIRSGSTLVRILAVDTLTLVLVALLIAFAAAQGESYYLDAALILALLSFVSTLAAARFQSERETFS